MVDRSEAAPTLPPTTQTSPRATASTSAAAPESAPPGSADAGDSSPCLAGGEGFLRARLSGPVTAELDWKNARLACSGSVRPDGSGIRLKFSQTGPGASPWVLVFGISGVREGQPAKALPTNLTLIREATGEFFGTQGEDKCTVDELRQTALTEGPRLLRTYRVTARGFCIGPARAVRGVGAVLMTRFDFTGKVDYEDKPGKGQVLQ